MEGGWYKGLRVIKKLIEADFSWICYKHGVLLPAFENESSNSSLSSTLGFYVLYGV